MAEATGLSRGTIRAGLQDLARADTPAGPQAPSERFRRRGGGRNPLRRHAPHRLHALETLVEPVPRGDPGSLLRWPCKSAAQVAAALQAQGPLGSARTVNRLLHDLGYRRQSNRTTLEGSTPPDRDAPCQYIHRRAQAFQTQGHPVVAVDTTKKARVGQCRTGGRAGSPQGQPEEVGVHDCPSTTLGKVMPYGVSDEATNTGWVSVGVEHDTAAVAVETVRCGWRPRGSQGYPKAQRLLITAEGGGSTGSRCRRWKVELQRRANETGLRISVCPFPPGTSQWNNIEHRMFCPIPAHGRGRPLVRREGGVNLIGPPTTTTGLAIRSALEDNSDPTGREVTAEQRESLALKQEKFHGEWHDTLRPRV